MGTVIFHPCYSLPGFSTSSQCSKQPKLRTSIFFMKGIADGSREAFLRFPRLKVSSKILDIEGDGRKHDDGRVRPPKKKILRNQTPTIRESDINALVKQVQSSLRKETADKVVSQETAASSSKRSSASGGGGSSESKSPAAEFWENHLRSRNQVLAEKPPAAKEENGALPKPKKNQTVGDTTTKPAQKKKNRIAADTTKAASHIPEIPQPVVVDLKSTRPRSNFKKRSPISPLPVQKLLLSSEAAASPVVEAKAEKPLQVVAARTEEPEDEPAQGEMELPKLSSEAMPVVAARTEAPSLDRMTILELRVLAKSRGVSPYSRLKKAELVEILESLE